MEVTCHERYMRKILERWGIFSNMSSRANERNQYEE